MPPDLLRGLMAVDLDGTLAVADVISDADIRVADRLRSAGIPVLVITGKNRHSLHGVQRL